MKTTVNHSHGEIWDFEGPRADFAPLRVFFFDRKVNKITFAKKILFPGQNDRQAFPQQNSRFPSSNFFFVFAFKKFMQYIEYIFLAFFCYGNPSVLASNYKYLR